MALTRSIGAYDDGTVLAPGVGTTPLDTRKSLSALWASAGVVAGGPSPLVTGTTGFAYSVAGPVPFVTTRGPSDGFAMFTNDGAASVTCPGAPGSGLQRIDILWVRHPTNTENSDTSSMPIFGVASGTAVSSGPAAPSIPTGALELARNTMTSAATSTASTGNTIAQTAAVAALRGTTGMLVEGAVSYGASWGAPVSQPSPPLTLTRTGTEVTLRGGSIENAGTVAFVGNGQAAGAFTIPVGFHPGFPVRVPATVSVTGITLAAAQIIVNPDGSGTLQTTTAISSAFTGTVSFAAASVRWIATS